MAKRGRPRKVSEVETKQKEQMSLSKSVQTQRKVIAVKPMDLTGTTKETAIDLTGESDIPMAVSRHLERMFGVPLPGTEEKQTPWPRDGQYFIKSESIHQNMKRTEKYKVIYIEDSHGNNHILFFKIPQTRMA